MFFWLIVLPIISMGNATRLILNGDYSAGVTGFILGFAGFILAVPIFAGFQEEKNVEA